MGSVGQLSQWPSRSGSWASTIARVLASRNASQHTVRLTRQTFLGRTFQQEMLQMPPSTVILLAWRRQRCWGFEKLAYGNEHALRFCGSSQLPQSFRNLLRHVRRLPLCVAHSLPLASRSEMLWLHKCLFAL